MSLAIAQSRPAAKQSIRHDSGVDCKYAGCSTGGVTGVAVQLQKDGIIQYKRGRITVLDRKRLEN
jgi:hypothetical protein